MRSDEAMAPWRRLYFSDRSWMGRKNRRAYWMNAATTPTVIAPCKMEPPPYQTMSARAIDVNSSMAGKNRA